MTESAFLDDRARRILVISNIAMLLAITIHDADHIRQAAAWCYTITATLWVINIAVYLPSIAALVLAVRRESCAPLATSISSLLIASLFAKVHLWKPTFNAWGIWNKNFFVLGADWISWTILVFLVITGVVVAMAGAWVSGWRTRASSL